MTDVQICNRALTKLGITSYITSLSDTSTEGIVLNSVYASIRDALLSAFPWPFATKRASDLDSADPRDGWEYAFLKPDDCLQPQRMRVVGGPRDAASAEERVPFAEEADDDGTPILLCDLEEPEFVYTFRQTDTTKYPPAFIEALAYDLAAEIAAALAKADKEDGMRKKGILARLEAQAQALEGGQESPLPDPESIRVRS